MRSNREIGIQTEPLKVGETIIEKPSGMQNSYSELSTELEGVKLDLVIMESRIMGSVCSNTKAMDQIRSDMATLRNEQSEMKMIQQSQHVIRTCVNKHKNPSEKLETTFDENINDINKAETNKNANIEQQPKAYNRNKNTLNNNTNYIFPKQQTKAINPIRVEPRQENLNEGPKEKNRDNFSLTIQENPTIKYHTKKALYIGELPLIENYIPQIQVDRSSESHNGSQNDENLNPTLPLFGELPLSENYTPQIHVDRSSESHDESQNDGNPKPISPLFNPSSQQQHLRNQQNGNFFRKRPCVIPPRVLNNDLNLRLNQRSQRHPLPRHLHNSRGSNIPQNQQNGIFFRKRSYPIPPPPPDY